MPGLQIGRDQPALVRARPIRRIGRRTAEQRLKTELERSRHVPRAIGMLVEQLRDTQFGADPAVHRLAERGRIDEALDPSRSEIELREPHRIVLARARTEKNKQYEGKRIAQIARMRGEEDPMNTCIELMAEEGGNISGIFHTMDEADVRAVMKLPWVSVASDGSAINLQAPGVPHPRNYSTNVRVLGHYVRDEMVLTLPEAVRKMTSVPAQILGLGDRGRILEGLLADTAVVTAGQQKLRNGSDVEVVVSGGRDRATPPADKRRS